MAHYHHTDRPCRNSLLKLDTKTAENENKLSIQIMIAKSLFFLVTFALAGSQFLTPSTTIAASLNEKIMLGDIKSLHSILDSNSFFLENPSTEVYRNGGFRLAVQQGRVPVVELLLKKANVNAASNQNIAIRDASTFGNAAIVKLLLARREVNPGAMDNEALLMAASNGHTEVVRLLLAHPKLDPSIGMGPAAVFAASEGDHTNIVRLLIGDGRVIPSINALHILQRAVTFENVELVHFLLGYPSFSQIAHFAAISDLSSIRTLVEAGYKFDEETLKSTIRYAQAKGNDDVVRYLKTINEPSKPPVRPLIPMTEQCAICMADNNLLEGFVTSCNHHFHADCLQKWTKNHRSCPMCRAVII